MTEHGPGAERRAAGTLESEVLGILRAAAGPLTPGEVRDRLSGAGQRELAYSTVVTTMSRLHAKGLLSRRQAGRGFCYAPVDEAHYPVPTTTYALSKVASETIAGQIAQWSSIPFIGLRFSNIMAPDDYASFPSFWSDPHERKWNLWGYVDARDVAAACRLALEAPVRAVSGSPNLIIAAADTVMNTPSAALLQTVFPEVSITKDIGEFETLLAIGRARHSLGYEPRHSWRDHVHPS